MPFVPTHVTRYELVQYYIGLFYKEIALYPSRAKDLNSMLEVLDRLNEEYMEVLSTKYCEWDSEEMRGKFRESMDFLTGAFSTRIRKREMMLRKVELIRKAEEIRVRNERQALERRILEGIEKKVNSQ